ncbi:MAG TPA: cobalamin biosynthesis protein [Methanosarcinales archaeon]|nr:cobalamin biosynthesis protein [Methanosarcinales archaeon]
MPAIITFKNNMELANKIKSVVGGEILLYSKDVFERAWKHRSIIAIMSVGIVVRKIAPLIKSKWTDPPVVVVSNGYAIPIIGGHHGANELARKLPFIPVITNREMVYNDSTNYIIGIGTRRGVSKEEVLSAISQAIEECGIKLMEVRSFASASMKKDEVGLRDAISALGKEIVFVPYEVINTMTPESNSKASRFGLTGVAEPSALALSREKKLILKKRVYENVTIAIAK